MKKGLIICLISVSVTLVCTELYSRYKFKSNKKEARLMILKQLIINESNADFKNMHIRLKKNLNKINNELTAYIDKYDRKKSEYNILASQTKRRDLKLSSIPRAASAKNLKRAIHKAMNKF